MKPLSKTRRRIALFTPLSLLTLALLVLEPVTNAEPLVSNYQQQQHQQPFSGTTDKQLRHVKKVAVIGAGSGGSSAAHFLRKLATSGDHDVEITVYERNPYVGGRTTTVNVHNDPKEPVELGGSIFVKVNENLYNATKEFGLECNENYISRRQAKDALGVYNGEEFVFRQPYDTTWWNNLAIIWKYGLAPIRTEKLMKQTVGKFLQFYKPPVFPFSSLSEAVEQTGLLQATSHTGEQFLEMNGLSGKFATDLIQASTRVNYAQNLGLIHGLETMVCMATDDAMSVKGGNWRIFKAMLDASKATVHLNTAVTKLDRPSSGGKWVVHSKPVSDAEKQGDESDHKRTEEYDAVILASPYQFSDLEIHPKLERTPDKIPYVKLHVTLFASPLRLYPAYFKLPADQEVPDMVLTTLNATEQQDDKIKGGEGVHGVGNTGFFSISLLRKIEREVNGAPQIEYLYKIFSPRRMSHGYIRSFLGMEPDLKKGEDEDDDVITWSHKKVWHSYPFEYPRVTFENIILDDEKTLFYTSGIESFISTMETSSLMGMNVARLLVDSWETKREQKLQHVAEELKIKVKP